ncbi:MAG: shikimate kinase [Calditrichaeota bacterium]|nr:MAG: shikimate kinase [Calditrichota bacterium]
MKANVKGSLFLVGFMGAGKTTVGKLLAARLGRRFLDTDEIIEHQSGLTIERIFKLGGEKQFRRMESEIVEVVCQNGPAVIALGGGAVCGEENWMKIRQSGVTFYLRWNINVLLSRILNDEHRPLTRGKKNGADLVALFESRRPRYEASDYIIDCPDSAVPEQIVEQILRKVGA